MRKLAVDVSYSGRFGYIATGSELPQPVRALSLSGLRRLIGDQFPNETLDLRLALDRTAKLERDARRTGGPSRASDFGQAR